MKKRKYLFFVLVLALAVSMGFTGNTARFSVEDSTNDDFTACESVMNLQEPPQATEISPSPTETTPEFTEAPTEPEETEPIVTEPEPSDPPTEGTQLDIDRGEMPENQTEATVAPTEDNAAEVTTTPPEKDNSIKIVPMLAPGDKWYTGRTKIARSSITQIAIVDSIDDYDMGTTSIVDQWDASTDYALDGDKENGPVTAYVLSDYTLVLAGNGYGCIYANQNSKAAFSSTNGDYFSAVETFSGGSLLNTSKVTAMNFMFYHCTSLTALDVSTWDVSKVKTFSAMFCGNNHVGDMKLKELSVSNWNTPSATDMSWMFYGCGQLTELDLHQWDVSGVTTMYHMFADCFNLTSIDFTGWDTASLTDIDGMFNDCRSLVTIDVSDFDTGAVIDYDQAFESCHNLKTIIGLENWDTSSAKSFAQAFASCFSLTKLDLSAWDTSSVNTVTHMFRDCSSLEAIYVSDKWDVSNAKSDPITVDGVATTHGADIFVGCTSLLGGNGTAYSADHVDADYAHIDGGTENPGYLSCKAAS